LGSVNGLAMIVALAAMPTACRKSPPPSDSCNPLDRAGRDLLSPMREHALPPEDLIARLHLRGDEVVADVGAGPGYLSLPLAVHLPRGKVLATDVDQNYLCVLRQRASAARLSNIETRLVSKDDPGLAPRSVDLALLVQVDHYLDDRAGYFSALRLALRPCGHIAIVNFRRYRDADVAAAGMASLAVSEEVEIGADFFLLVLVPAENIKEGSGQDCRR
jgi:SAM-dependent methyltransferase